MTPADVGVEDLVVTAVLWLRLGIEALGATVIGLGAVLATLRFVRGPFPLGPENFENVRLTLARRPGHRGARRGTARGRHQPHVLIRSDCCCESAIRNRASVKRDTSHLLHCCQALAYQFPGCITQELCTGRLGLFFYFADWRF